MATVMELLPGDEVSVVAPEGAKTAVFVAETAHPLWPSLRLVVWRLDSGEWSHDALSALQEVGTVRPSSSAERVERLRAALLGRDVIPGRDFKTRPGISSTGRTDGHTGEGR
jgi:hypothetical protein